MQISIRAVELVDNDRKKVLIQRAKEVKSMIYNSNLSLDGIISKGYYLYEKKYKERRRELYNIVFIRTLLAPITRQ